MFFKDFTNNRKKSNRGSPGYYIYIHIMPWVIGHFMRRFGPRPFLEIYQLDDLNWNNLIAVLNVTRFQYVSLIYAIHLETRYCI